MIRNFSKIVIIVITVFTFFYIKNERFTGWNGKAWTCVLNGDGYGYYVYLPALVINHNLDYKTAFKAELKVRPDFTEAAFLNIYYIIEGKQLNKCFVGPAVVWLPSFLVACLVSKVFGYDVDGFSYPFEIILSLTALLYFVIGLIFLRKLMKIYNINEFIIAFLLILVSFGTNLFYYVTIEPSMSHVYSFSLFAVFLFFAKKAMTEFKLKKTIWLAITLGLLILIRPINVIMALSVFFIAGDLKTLRSFIINLFTSPHTILLLVVICSIVSIQFIMWHAQMGQWFIWSYQNEGFNFKDPHISDILFSYRKGWFLYTPFMFITVCFALMVLFRKDFYLFFSLFLVFAPAVYILSSWSDWVYGGGFGSRPFIDYYPLFIVALGISMRMVKRKWVDWAVVGLSIFCLPLNIIQVYQRLNYILPYSGMNKDKYWAIFLKADRAHANLFYSDYGPFFKFDSTLIFRNDFEHNSWGNDTNITSEYSFSGNYSAFVNEKRCYSPIFSITAGELPNVQNLYIYVRLYAYLPDFDNDASIVVNVLGSKDKKAYYTGGRQIKNCIVFPGRWEDVEYAFALPAFHDSSDMVYAYVYTSKGLAYIDDEEIKFGVHR